MTPPLVALGAPTGGCNGSGGTPGCCPLPSMPPHPVPTHLQPSAWRRCCSWEPSGAGACRGCGAAPAGGRRHWPQRCSGAACLGAEPRWGAQRCSESLMLPPCHPFPGHPPTQQCPSTGGMFGEGAGGSRALPAPLRGDPRASPSPSCTCTLPMSPSMCSEGPWPGCFSRSVSVLEGAEGHQAVPCCPRPPSHPAVPPPVPRHVQRGHFKAGKTPRRGWARGARAAAGRRLHRWLWRTRCRSRRPPGTRQHETLNAIT